MSTKKTTAKAKKPAVKKEEVKTPEVTTPEVQEPQTPEVTPEPTPEPVKANDVIGSLKGWKQVHQKINTVRIKAMRGPISKRELPPDLQRWLTNKGYGTNVYLQPKEWLEKHNVDMKMVEKLKKFINDRYL